VLALALTGAVFWIESPSGSSFEFTIGKKKGQCVLRLFRQVKTGRYSRREIANNVWFLAKRPLPECACVP
jgi:hypothetical protein